MRKLEKAIKRGRLRMVVYLVLFSFSFFALLPRVADAKVVVKQAGIAKMDREQDLAKIRAVLERKEVQSRLEALGMSPSEVEKRLSLLSDEEIHQLALNLNALNPGGDAFGTILVLLVLAGLVILILYLAGVIDFDKLKKEKKPKK